MKKIGFCTVALISATVGFTQSNYNEIKQVGLANDSYVEQDGYSNGSIVEQDGETNFSM
jgi:hypothetical protein